MINPFEVSGDIDHIPENISRAFDVVAGSSSDTASLLASKSKLFTISSMSQSNNKDHQNSLKKSTPSIAESSLNMADLTCSDTFAVSKSSTEELKKSKPPLSVKPQEKKIHCETCKCLETHSLSTLKMTESASLQYLSKLESIPLPKNFSKQPINKPYTSPIYKLPDSPSQIFRQRINAHVLQMKLIKQNSEPNIFAKYPNKNYLY